MEPTPYDNNIVFNAAPGREALRITPDGNIVIAEGVTLTEASRVFYDSVRELFDPDRVVRQIDLKHHVDENGNIVKTGNGVVVPLDEPLILFRGRDYLALPLLMKYRQMCERDGCNDFQLKQVDALVDKFAKFASENPGVMKQPGITRGL